MRYKALDKDINKMQVVELVGGPYAGCQLVYGGVHFGDEQPDGSAMLHFDYEVVNGFTVEKNQMEAFLNYLGDTLLEIIQDSMEASSTVYKGGSNEGADEWEPIGN